MYFTSPYYKRVTDTTAARQNKVKEKNKIIFMSIPTYIDVCSCFTTDIIKGALLDVLLGWDH